ncbi:hypothetical protein ACQKIE_03285 [Luteibacter sp. NPDC031894]|jgi:hypothetical protein|uniref:hypothetical protein n=1 Tax=Luteibacter sp. NPDC031894 TaxID=3390572 RepID=UPI003D04986A
MSDNGYRCGHAPCECTVMDSSAYCCEHCEKAAGEGMEGPCGCGHEACEHRQKREAQASDPGYAGPT